MRQRQIRPWNMNQRKRARRCAISRIYGVLTTARCQTNAVGYEILDVDCRLPLPAAALPPLKRVRAAINRVTGWPSAAAPRMAMKIPPHASVLSAYAASPARQANQLERPAKRMMPSSGKSVWALPKAAAANHAAAAKTQQNPRLPDANPTTGFESSGRQN